MAALTNKWCTVLGLASRPELNGLEVWAMQYDEARGRYKVQLPSNHQISLKGENLQLCDEQKPPPVIKSAQPEARASTKKPSAKQEPIPWQTVLMVLFGAWWVYSNYNSGSSRASPVEQYSAEDTGYLKGEVREVLTHEQFQAALQQHGDDTGLPVVVDFFSHSCGPCRMIEPTFRSMAGQYAGRAVFLKVDVNANHQTSSVCGVRSMPTFQFYLQGRLQGQFSGADSQRLAHLTEASAAQVEGEGTACAGKELTVAAMEEFYTKHPPGKQATAAGIVDKYKGKCSKLLRLLMSKYGAVPELAEKAAPPPEHEAEGVPAAGVSLAGVPEAALRGELVRRYEDSTVDSFAGTPDTSGVHKLVVIGGGPAGLAAALYAARAGLSPVVVAPQLGGQLLSKGVDVENYPGVASGSGRGIVAEMRHQASSLYKSKMVDDMVASVDFSSSPFKLTLNSSAAVLRSHSVVIAAGADSKWLGVPGEHTYRGGGVSSCATCDGFLAKGKKVLVVGGGDTAMEEALVLARICSQVHLVHRRDKFRASKTMAARVLSHPRIKVHWNSTVKSFEGVEQAGQHTLTAAQLVSPAGSHTLEVAAAFVAIGHEPNTAPFKGQLSMDPQGYLQLKGRSSHSSVEGVFAAGDVADKVYRQAVTSAGTGAMAALDAERWLSEHGLGIE